VATAESTKDCSNNKAFSLAKQLCPWSVVCRGVVSALLSGPVAVPLVHSEKSFSVAIAARAHWHLVTDRQAASLLLAPLLLLLLPLPLLLPLLLLPLLLLLLLLACALWRKGESLLCTFCWWCCLWPCCWFAPSEEQGVTTTHESDCGKIRSEIQHL